ncbi:hypothetical protein HDG33_006571 [Paraburkholderia sp. Cpub6]|nr:hypothetical protein [Paraburkholderia sp. Cpub6]
MTDRIVCRCRHCGNETEVFGSSFCAAHADHWLTEMYRRFDDLCEEGYTRYQARIMAGLADPAE